ncbi:MAG: two-component system nitrate/nitrite sensor histidine kinase NarX [Gammaproteobacteria bacterium]|jgi:two-component system nitrate/nitrite sensor histidine kinase NarX
MHTLQKKPDLYPKLAEPDPILNVGMSLPCSLFKSLVLALIGLILAVGLIWTDYPIVATLALIVSMASLLWAGYSQQRSISITPPQTDSDYQSERFLFDPIHRLIESPEITEPFGAILKSVRLHTKAARLAVFVFEEQSGQLALLATDDAPAGSALPDYLPLRVLSQIEKTGNTLVDISDHFNRGSTMAIGLWDDESLYGILLIEQKISEPEQRVFYTRLANQLSEVICCSRRAQVNRRQEVYQERAVIARELHDSLAQSLTYLKIQSTRLQSNIDRNKRDGCDDYSKLDIAVDELRSNLNRAYSQLRELMTTFRLTMNGKHLASSIEDSIIEFEKRTTIVIDSDIRVSGEEFSAEEELQLLQLVREGLSNIVRHSHATRANISLDTVDDHVVLKIVDNGIGIGPIPDQLQHHGLIIMQERAQRLGGVLRVEPSQTAGTHLKISFIPTHSLQQQAETNHA